MPRKIAVIGGGVGAITAVYAITQLPNWEKDYDITLYQMGWRLGGKGASGRNMKKGGRIEEHGLHIWAGFYENGFRLMRDCYEQLHKLGLRNPDMPLGTLEKAFEGLNHFFLTEEVEGADGEKHIHPWRVDFSPNDEQPGTGKLMPSPFSLFKEFLGFVASLLKQVVSETGPLESYAVPKRFHAHLQKNGLTSAASSPLELLHEVSKKLSHNAFDHSSSDRAVIADLARHTQQWYLEQQLEGRTQSDASRRIHIMISLSTAFLRGAIECDLFRKGFDAIDDQEISEWLARYGAPESAIYSAVFRGCYDYVFGYPGGVIDHRRVGAGTAIRGLLRLGFTYKGSLFYKMKAGMGDTIFAPYYQVLKERGVKFRYFNAATNLKLDEAGNQIDAIDMVEQAEVKSGADYAPLVDVKDLPCWPSEPLWEQLVDGAKLEKQGVDFECEKNPPSGRAYTLKRGEDFDDVILGASIGSLHYLTPDLAKASERWRMMLEKVQTVATHAAQFWLDSTAKDMGWNALVSEHNPGKQTNLRSVTTGFSEPLDTWADMSDLLGREDWPDPQPKSIAYFCSPAHDAGVDEGTMRERTKAWADSELTRMWPKAQKAGKFDLSLLHDNKARTGQKKFDAQYFRENFYGSERYVLSVPNSVQYRLPPDGSGFGNLYLAGDWTRCGINAGCVEAASISGLACARGLTGADIPIIGEGDLAPDAGPTDAAKLATPYAQTAPWPLTPMFATGKIDGFFSFHAVDAKALESVLPKGMSLHPQTLTPEGTHPVAILANQQMGVRASITPGFLAYRNYFEGIIAINHVQVEGHNGIFSYLPNLYLNSRIAQLTGVFFYGYNKRMGKLEMGHNHYKVAGTDNSPIWSGHYNQPDFARPLMDYPQAGTIGALSEQIVVSEGKFRRWHFSSFDFNLTSAYVAGVHANIEVQNSELANIPAGHMVAQPLRLDGHQAYSDNKLPGAFRIWTSWTLSNPFDSQRIAKLADDQAKLP